MGNTILITGANRGIGFAMAQRLDERGDTVIAACRSSNDGLDALGVRVETGVDVTSDESLSTLNGRLGSLELDWLVLNAGIMYRESLDDLNAETMRQQFEVNSLGPLRTVGHLRSRLRSGSKVGIVTSRMGSIADNDSGGYYGYRMSKAAVNAAGESLAVDLKGDGVAVVLLHPGFVQTDMTGQKGHVTAAQSAEGLVARLDELNLERSGEFRHMNGEVLPW